MTKIITSLLLLCSMLVTAQTTLSGTIENADLVKWVLLKESYGTNSRVVTKSAVLENETYTLSLPSNLKSGMYKLMYNIRENKGIDFYYNGTSLVLNFNAHPDFFKVNFRNNPESTWYYKTLKELYLEEYQLQVLNQFIQSYTANTSLKTQAITQYKKSVVTLEKKFTKLDSKAHPTATLLKAQQRYYPDTKDDVLLQNYYQKQHFFKYIDVKDSLLMGSTVFVDKVMEYISFLRNEQATEDDYIAAVDVVLAWAAPNTELKDMLIIFLGEGFRQFDMPKVIAHIDVNYKSEQCDADKDIALQERLAAYERLSIGKKAPDFLIGEKTLYSQTAENYVVAFWGSWCGACEAILPGVNQYLSTQKNVLSIAVGLDTDKEAWLHAKSHYPNFTHIRAAEKWDNSIVKEYAIYASPTFYVLDKDHVIVGKAKNLVELRALLPH